MILSFFPEGNISFEAGDVKKKAAPLESHEKRYILSERDNCDYPPGML